MLKVVGVMGVHALGVHGVHCVDKRGTPLVVSPNNKLIKTNKKSWVPRAEGGEASREQGPSRLLA